MRARLLTRDNHRQCRAPLGRIAVVAAIAWMAMVPGAQAAPTFSVSGDGLTVTDPFTGRMWLQDANLARSQHYGGTTTGLMDWGTATNWVDYLNQIRYAGYQDWRLWRVDARPFCTDLGCRDSEMADLFIDMGGLSGCSIYTCHNDNFALFSNVQGRPGQNPVAYWGESDGMLSSYKVTYNMLRGDQGSSPPGVAYYGWAVRIPTPGTLPLMLAGALAAVALTRRQARWTR